MLFPIPARRYFARQAPDCPLRSNCIRRITVWAERTPPDRVPAREGVLVRNLFSAIGWKKNVKNTASLFIDTLSEYEVWCKLPTDSLLSVVLYLDAFSKENTVLRAGLVPRKVSVIPNAIDTSLFLPDETQFFKPQTTVCFSNVASSCPTGQSASGQSV